MVKHLPTVQETGVPSLGWEDPLEKAMAPHSSTLAWKIPWTEELGGLYIVHGVAKSQTRLIHFTFSSVLGPGGTVTVKVHMHTSFKFTIVFWIPWTQVILAFSARCWQGLLHVLEP